MYKKIVVPLAVLALATANLSLTPALAQHHLDNDVDDMNQLDVNSIPASTIKTEGTDKATNTYALNPGNISTIVSQLEASIADGQTLTLSLGEGTYYLPKTFNKPTVIRGMGDKTMLARGFQGEKRFATTNKAPLSVSNLSIPVGAVAKTVFMAEDNLTLDKVNVSAPALDLKTLKSQSKENIAKTVANILPHARASIISAEKGKVTVSNSTFSNVSGISTNSSDAVVDVTANTFMPPIAGHAINLTWGAEGTTPASANESYIGSNIIDSSNGSGAITVGVDNVLLENNNFTTGAKNKAGLNSLKETIENGEKFDEQDYTVRVLNYLSGFDMTAVSVQTRLLPSGQEITPQDITLLSNTFAGSGEAVAVTDDMPEGGAKYGKISLVGNVAKNNFDTSKALVFNEGSVSFEKQSELSAPAFHTANQKDKKTTPVTPKASVYDPATFSIGDVNNGILTVSVNGGLYSDDDSITQKGGSLQHVLDGVKAKLPSLKGVKQVVLSLAAGSYVSPMSTETADGISLKIVGSGKDNTKLIRSREPHVNHFHAAALVVENPTEISNLSFTTIQEYGPVIIAEANLAISDVNFTSLPFDMSTIDARIDQLAGEAADKKAGKVTDFIDVLTYGAYQNAITTGDTDTAFNVSLNNVMVDNLAGITSDSKVASFDIKNSSFITPLTGTAIELSGSGENYTLNNVKITAKNGSKGLVSSVDNLRVEGLNVEAANGHENWVSKLQDLSTNLEGLPGWALTDIKNLSNDKTRAITLNKVDKKAPKNVSIQLSRAMVPDDEPVVYASFGMNDGVKIMPEGTKVAYDWSDGKNLPEGMVRMSGATRFETAVDIAKKMFPNGSKTVIIARHDDPVDALATAPLAKYLDAPVLLTQNDTLHDATKTAIADLVPAGSTVHIVGGEKAVSSVVAQQLMDAGYKVERVSGSNRSGTAVAIAKKIGATSGFVVDGTNWGQALVAGPAATTHNGAVLLNYGTNKAPETEAFIKDVLKGHTHELSAGSNLAEMSTNVAKEWFANSPVVAVATAGDFADSLTGGAAAAKAGAPILLVDNKVSADQAALIAKAKTTLIFGGEKALPSDSLTSK